MLQWLTATVRLVSPLLLLWLVHWYSVQIYTTFCAPPGFLGLLHSVFTNSSTVCRCLRGFHDSSGEMFTFAIATLFSSCLSKLYHWHRKVRAPEKRAGPLLEEL
jgi:hypothetical protein